VPYIYIYMHNYNIQVMNPHSLTADGRCKIAMIRRKNIMLLDAAGTKYVLGSCLGVFHTLCKKPTEVATNTLRGCYEHLKWLLKKINVAVNEDEND
jgi:hypothetical protein